MDWNPVDLFDEWIRTKKLSRRKVAYLEQWHQHHLHGAINGLIGFMHTAPAYICKATNNPEGCSLWGCVADLLDNLESIKVGHKVTWHNYQLMNNTYDKNPPITEEEPVTHHASKIINELNVLSDFIANEEISESRKDFLLGKHDETLGNMEYVMVHGSKWRTETCPDSIIEGLNNFAKTTEYPKRLDNCYPYWELAIAFSLDLINWIEKDENLESELSEKLDQINYQMNYFAQEFESVLPF